MNPILSFWMLSAYQLEPSPLHQQSEIISNLQSVTVHACEFVAGWSAKTDQDSKSLQPE
ncbi:hypothetical protein P8S54_08650 [Thiomicrospira sp. R3]|uniref:hypothetical protein n=1 Tax=Thiomicrospira sp. R3 TaxID=3035472 RepID=UPI00259BDECE|nr:hypothetical protein [Thiomicrospira sp. R3]WFE68281.1 hypothetical protein P8S54_08650 [Thiomicrospira sp. R3]